MIGRHEHRKPSRLLIFFFHVRAAWILWTQRKRAGLSLALAAEHIGIGNRSLRRYELGLESPPCRTIYALLELYGADSSAVSYFCTLPFPAPSLAQYMTFAWRRRAAPGPSDSAAMG